MRAVAERFPDVPRPIDYFVNGEEILAGIRDCLQKIQQHLGTDITRIKAASFAGQGSSLLCWNNQTGAALTPVLSWQDIRGEPYLNTIPLTHQQAQQLTGLRLSPHYGASKMRWCLEKNAQVIDAQKNHCLGIGPIVSYIFWHLFRSDKYSNKNSNKSNSKIIISPLAIYKDPVLPPSTGKLIPLI